MPATTRFLGRPVFRYGIAVVTVLIAALLRHLVVQIVGELPLYITFCPAVMLTAVLAGLGPGLVATILAAIVADYWVIPPDGFAITDPADAVGLGIFCSIGALMSAVAELYRRARQTAAESEKQRAVAEEQARAADEIRQQKELLAVTLASIGDGVIVTDLQGRVTFLNAEAERLTGWKNEEACAQPLASVLKIIHERTRQPVESPVDKVLRLGTTVGLANHTVLVAKDGREIPIDDSGAPIRDAGGTVQGVVLVFRDFTERKEAERVLARLAAIVESSDDAILSTDLAGIIQTWNTGAERLFGYRAEEIVGSPITLLLPSGKCGEDRQILDRLRRGEHVQHLETVRVDKHGRRIAVSVSASPVRDQDARIIGASKIVHDITERKAKEEQLGRLNRTLKALSESNQALMRAKNEASYLQNVCRIITEDCGYAMVWIGFAEEDQRRSVRPVAYAGFDEGYLETLQVTWADTDRGRGPTGTAIRTGQAYSCRNMLTDPAFLPWREEARKRGYASSLALPLVSEGRAFGALTIYSREPDPFSDSEEELLKELADDLAFGITALRLREARAQAEKEVRRHREWLSVTLSSIGDAVLATDTAGRVTFLNPVATALTGWTPEEALGQPVACIFRTIHEKTRQPAADIVAQVLSERRTFALANHTALITKQGCEVPIEDSAAPILDASGDVAGVVLVFHDVTEKRRAQTALLASEERFRLLADVSSQLLISNEPQRIVESLCRKVMEHLGCDAFFNYLVDESTGRLHLNACAGVPPEMVPQAQWLDRGAAVCGCVARDGVRIVAEQIQTTADPRTGLVRSFGIQAYACHPLVNQGRVVGTLSFGSRWKTHFQEDELSLMKAVADHVAIAMQRMSLLESLKEHAQKAEAANVAKSQFLASMSHELRTPMNAILGMTELALNEDLSPVVRDYLNTTQESADALLGLLNEVLDLSRIESGRLQLESTAFGLRAMLGQTLKSLSVRACEKGLDLLCDVGDDVPDALVGDPLRVRQVLVNLLGNAVKFTPQGKIVVRVEIDESAAGDGSLDNSAQGGTAGEPPADILSQFSAAHPQSAVCLRFSVQDTGIGISPQDQQRIFAPFTQADASTTRHYGGTGLGLTISRSLVSAMGGRLWLESRPGQGSTFFFSIPLGIQADAARQPADNRLKDPLSGQPELVAHGDPDGSAPKPLLQPRRALRVLMAEDIQPNQKLVERALGKRGHHIVVANDGREAIEWASRDQFDVILMDVQMPAMDGFQATAAIRAMERIGRRRVPIIALTAHAFKGDAERCLAAGMDAYLSKPIQIARLVEMVESLADRTTVLDSAECSPAVGAAEHAGEPAHGAQAEFLLEEALASLAGEEELFRQMVGFFFTDAPKRLTEIKDALEHSDATVIAKAAHRLKGTVVYLGAKPAQQILERLEGIGGPNDLPLAARLIPELEARIAALAQLLTPYHDTDAR